MGHVDILLERWGLSLLVIGKCLSLCFSSFIGKFNPMEGLDVAHIGVVKLEFDIGMKALSFVVNLVKYLF